MNSTGVTEAVKLLLPEQYSRETSSEFSATNRLLGIVPGKYRGTPWPSPASYYNMSEQFKAAHVETSDATGQPELSIVLPCTCFSGKQSITGVPLFCDKSQQYSNRFSVDS